MCFAYCIHFSIIVVIYHLLLDFVIIYHSLLDYEVVFFLLSNKYIFLKVKVSSKPAIYIIYNMINSSLIVSEKEKIMLQ